MKTPSRRPRQNTVPGSDGSVPLADLFRVYGIKDAGDIVSVCEYRETLGIPGIRNRITDRAAIDAFFQAAVPLEPYGNDGFQKAEIEVFPTEEERVRHYGELADDRLTLRIETAEGLFFYIHAYPSYGWLYSQCYYAFDDAMRSWFAEYIR